MSDPEREALIRTAGQQMEAWMAEHERTGCFASRGCADFWRLRMEALIHGRSPAQVARMEMERGLA